MYVLLVLSAFVLSVLEARQPDVDINRLVVLPKESSDLAWESAARHERRSVDQYQLDRSNDNDDRSGGYTGARASLRVHDAPAQVGRTPLAVYLPREDPRLFYQSDTYLKETGAQNVNDVSQIYPGNNVIRPGNEYKHKSLPLRMKHREDNSISDSNVCVRCPPDRTLIAKAGMDRVLLQRPRLAACSGLKPPRGVRFVHMYGPTFGSLLENGSHMVVGKIVNKNKSLQLCKMQIHVMTRGCDTPKYLVAHCGESDKPCHFTCRDPNHDLSTNSSLFCGHDMKWSGDLPKCKTRTWCLPPSLPDHGHLNCKGSIEGAGELTGLSEGARCRVRCAHGWRPANRGPAVCRRSRWTKSLSCQPQRRTNVNVSQ